jgi:hypothetical protein
VRHFRETEGGGEFRGGGRGVGSRVASADILKRTPADGKLPHAQNEAILRIEWRLRLNRD